MRHTADVAVVSRSSHFCFVTQQTCLLCHTADMSLVSHTRHVCCVPQQTRLLRHTAGMSAVSHSRHVCCVSHSRMPLKSEYFLSGFREQRNYMLCDDIYIHRSHAPNVRGCVDKRLAQTKQHVDQIRAAGYIKKLVRNISTTLTEVAKPLSQSI